MAIVLESFSVGNGPFSERDYPQTKHLIVLFLVSVGKLALVVAVELILVDERERCWRVDSGLRGLNEFLLQPNERALCLGWGITLACIF